MEPIWNGAHFHCAILDDGFYIFTLWAWRTDGQSVRNFQCRAKSMRLVSVTNQNTTDVCNFLIGHAKSKENVKLRRYYVWTRNIEEVIYISWAHSKFMNFKLNLNFPHLSVDCQHSFFIFDDTSSIQNILKMSKWLHRIVSTQKVIPNQNGLSNLTTYCNEAWKTHFAVNE